MRVVGQQDGVEEVLQLRQLRDRQALHRRALAGRGGPQRLRSKTGRWRRSVLPVAVPTRRTAPWQDPQLPRESARSERGAD